MNSLDYHSASQKLKEGSRIMRSYVPTLKEQDDYTDFIEATAWKWVGNEYADRPLVELFFLDLLGVIESHRLHQKAKCDNFRRAAKNTWPDSKDYEYKYWFDQ